MREAVKKLGGDPQQINPMNPAELVIDHSVQVDDYGQATSLATNNRIEFERNGERYAFLRWGQTAFRQFQASCRRTPASFTRSISNSSAASCSTTTAGDKTLAYPDTVVGTDSHTTMINGLGVLGWGVGGIEAEAAMLGQPIPMLIPQVIGFKMTGAMKPGCTATDLVLTVTEMLRKKGVVEKFVEFFGDGLANLPLADRATIANMAPEYGSTCGIFPIDEETLRYLELSGRPRRADRAGRGVCQGAGHVARQRRQAGGLHRRARARPRHGRTQPRGPEAPAGSRAAVEGEERLPGRAQGHGRRAQEEVARRHRLRGDPAGRQEGGDSRRRGHHRRHHELHQHLQSLRAHGRGPARAQCREARPQVQALGEDQPGARFTRRHRLPDQGRVVSAARVHRLQRRRLRLHHLHRQLRPAEAGDFRGHQGGRHRRHLGAVGQSQLRRPRASRDQDELPGVAAARGRVCARRHHGRGSADRSARPRSRRQTRVARQHLAFRQGSRRRGARHDHLRHVPQELRQCVRGRRQLAGHQDSRRARSTRGKRSPPTCATRPTSKA